MPIYRLLQRSPFGPDEIKVLAQAYEDLLKDLDLVDRTDPATMLIAKRVIEIAQTGVRDPAVIREVVMREFQSS